MCVHPQRKVIDRALVLKKQTQTAIAEAFGLNVFAVRRHRDNHLTAEKRRTVYAEAREEQKAVEKAAADVVVQSDRLDVIDSLTRLSGRVEAILKRAEDAGADDTALKAVAELRRQIELAARILGDLDTTSKTTVIIAEHPEWLRVRDILFRVLDRHPAAKADFIATAKELAGGRPQLGQ